MRDMSLLKEVQLCEPVPHFPVPVNEIVELYKDTSGDIVLQSTKGTWVCYTPTNTLTYEGACRHR